MIQPTTTMMMMMMMMATNMRMMTMKPIRASSFSAVNCRWQQQQTAATARVLAVLN